MDRFTSAIRHGNRTQSIEHRVGSWGYTDDDDTDAEQDEEMADPGGLELDQEEKFVAVEPPKGDTEGRWAVWWDAEDNKLKNVPEVAGRLVLRISIERSYVDTAEKAEE